MKKFLIIIITILFLTFLIPCLIVTRFCDIYTLPSQGEPYDTISVYIKNEDKVCNMDMSQYLKEVVAAEMPAEFEKEALKAQATAARTYLVNRKRNGNSDDVHKGADICTDSTHCKAWVSEEERKKIWGDDKKDEYWNKISEAVEETAGVMIYYSDNPISAVFHSTSSGITENASDVWGGDVPYLVSVESKGEENSPRYTSEIVLSEGEFKSIAEKNIDNLNWDKGVVSDIKRSEAGGIKTMKIGGAEISGRDFRTMYNLRSTNAEISFKDGNVILSVKGFGHGVGMSQYGANYLASQGYGYEDILKKYYTGVEVY